MGSICVKKLGPFLLLIVFTIIIYSYYTDSDNEIHTHFNPHSLKSPKIYPKPCPRFTGINFVIIITSHAAHFNLRQASRLAIPSWELERLGMWRIFLLAQHQPSESKVLEESENHKDILVGDFVEAYRNLTAKHIMGLKWILSECPHAHFVLKQDDDIYVDYYQLDEVKGILESEAEDGIVGKVLKDEEIVVIRERSSKWGVTKEEYEPEVYPSFVSGWGYITSPKVIRSLIQAHENFTLPLWIDDAYITGILRDQASIGLSDLSEQFTTFKGHLQCCVASSISTLVNMTPYWCDFLIGPSMGDEELFSLLHTHSKFCHTTRICGRRKGSQGLRNSCILTENMRLNRQYYAYNLNDQNNVKGKGQILRIS